MRKPVRAVATAKVALVRLRKWVPPAVVSVLQVLAERGAEAVLVGGAVRDVFLNKPSADWDIATDLVPTEVATLFPRVVRAGEKHGTIMVLTESGPVEVTTYRSEGPYLDGRRPSEVRFIGDLRGDLARRDFTINAMAVDLTRGLVHDPFGGHDDLIRGVIRCVGDPHERFAEDGLRPLRAVRFAGVLGFTLDQGTEAALSSTLETFAKVAFERKRDELEKLLARGLTLRTSIALLERSGLLAQLAPELLHAPPRRLGLLEALPNDEPWLRFAAWAFEKQLTPEQAADVLGRWRVATKDARRVSEWLRGLYTLPRRRAPDGSALRHWLARTGASAAEGASVLATTLLGGAYTGFSRRALEMLRRQPTLKIDQLAVRGEDLLALGIQGPAVGKTLQALLAAVLDDPRQNQRDTLLTLASAQNAQPKAAPS